MSNQYVDKYEKRKNLYCFHTKQKWFFPLSTRVKGTNLERYFTSIRRHTNTLLWGWDGNKSLTPTDFNSWWDTAEYDNTWGITVGETLEIRLLLVKIISMNNSIYPVDWLIVIEDSSGTCRIWPSTLTTSEEFTGTISNFLPSMCTSTTYQNQHTISSD